jgi:hypothetical protein
MLSGRHAGGDVVTVHHFKVWDQMRGDHIVPPLKSPAERIKQIGGTIIPGTAEDVESSVLDADGRYDPVPPVTDDA